MQKLDPQGGVCKICPCKKEYRYSLRIKIFFLEGRALGILFNFKASYWIPLVWVPSNVIQYPNIDVTH
jgi:hypothetical protein